LNLLTSSKTFLYDGVVHDVKKKKDLYLVLFSDSLFFSKSSGPYRYRFKHSIPSDSYIATIDPGLLLIIIFF